MHVQVIVLPFLGNYGVSFIFSGRGDFVTPRESAVFVPQEVDPFLLLFIFKRRRGVRKTNTARAFLRKLSGLINK